MVPLIYAVAGLGQLGLGAYNTYKQSQRAREAKGQLDKRLADYRNQDTSNLYANMENTYEDLTVNTQAANFTAQQQQQGFANTMQSLRGAAGGSGIAALAQSLAGQQSQAAQAASASIGQQEARNQQLAAGQASRLQMYERRGAEAARGIKAGMINTELTMAMQEQAAANNARNEALASAVGGAVNLGIGAGQGAFGDLGGMLSGGTGGGSTSGAPLANLTQGSTEAFTQVFDPNQGDKILPAGNYTPSYMMGGTAPLPTAASNPYAVSQGDNSGLEYLPYPSSTGNLSVMYQNSYGNG